LSQRIQDQVEALEKVESPSSHQSDERLKLKQEQDQEQYRRDLFVSDKDRAAFQPFSRRPEKGLAKMVSAAAYIADQTSTDLQAQSFKCHSGIQMHPQSLNSETTPTCSVSSRAASVASEFPRGSKKTASKKRRDFRSHKMVEDAIYDFGSGSRGSATVVIERLLDVSSGSSSTDVPDSAPSSIIESENQPKSLYLSSATHPLFRLDVKSKLDGSISPTTGGQGQCYPYAGENSMSTDRYNTQPANHLVDIASNKAVHNLDVAGRMSVRPWMVAGSASASAGSRLLRKHTDSVLEMRKFAARRTLSTRSGLIAATRSCSLDTELRPNMAGAIGTGSRFMASEDSIEEECEQPF